MVGGVSTGSGGIVIQVIKKRLPYENENVTNQLSTFLINAFRMRNHLMQSNT